MTLMERIWETSQKPSSRKGFTRYTYGLDRPVQGYCVAYADTQDSHGKLGLQSVLSHAQTHAQIVGGWCHGARFYFDSVRVYHTKKAAIEAAIRENQIGYYDLDDGYVEMMSGGNLLPQYQKMLDGWNKRRARLGMQPFKKL